MQANNLTISVPSRGCDKNCPYCVSRMTGYPGENAGLIMRNMPKVKLLAREAGVNSVLLTGKGEPFLNLPWVEILAREFEEYPLEIQTNGLRLKRDFEAGGGLVEGLYDLGFNTLAFSLDRVAQIRSHGPLFKRIGSRGMIVRVTFNVSSADSEAREMGFGRFLELCRGAGIRQVSLRRITIPEEIVEGAEAEETARWIREHSGDTLYGRWAGELLSMKPREIRRLSFGAVVYDWKGLSVTHFDYCIQERADSDDTRSLIFQEDGHLYTSWGSEASMLL